MFVAWTDFRQAVLTYVGSELEGDLDRAIVERLPSAPDNLNLGDAALVLAQAAVGVEYGSALNTPVASVGLIAAGRAVTLTPEVAGVHPLLRSWIPNDLGVAFIRGVLAGAILTTIGPGAPTLGDLTIERDAWGNVHGSQILTFEGVAQVILYFGALSSEAGFVTSRRISGEALHAVGASLRLTTGAPHEARQAAALEAADYAAVTDALQSAAPTVVH